MLGIPDHLLFAALTLFGPLWAATVGYRRLLRAAPDARPRVRRSVYRGAMVAQWALVAVVGAWWWVARRPWSALGLAPRLTWGLGGVLIGAAIMAVLLVRQRNDVMRDDDALDEVRRRMAGIEPMLPRSPAEMRAFVWLGITAGICEEILYRGFMIQYLAHAPWLGLLGAAAVSSVIFGLGHAYQGPRGMLLTGGVGAFLAAVYLVTGSLLAPMLLHALMDLHSGHLAYVAIRRAEELARERMRALDEERMRAVADESAPARSDDAESQDPPRDEPPAAAGEIA